MQFLVNISHSKVVELLFIVQLVSEPSKPKSGYGRLSPEKNPLKTTVVGVGLWSPL